MRGLSVAVIMVANSPRQHVRPVSAGRRRRSAPQLVAAILEARFQGRDGPVLIAIGGPGGTGKSTFARALAEHLHGDVAILTLDDYKTPRRERRQSGIFGAHPDANRMDLIADHLAAIRGGAPVQKPVYDPVTGDASRAEPFTPARWTLIDGEISTYRPFRDTVDFAVFIDSDWRTQLATRLGRDMDERKYSPEKAVATFLHSNLREFTEHGAESKSWADIHLFCHEDRRLELESVDSDLYAQVRPLLENDIETVPCSGLIVALLTPFDPDGQIAEAPFVEHLDWLASKGVRRVLVGGTTGEFFSLTLEERLELLKFALEYFPGMVLFQVGGGPLPDAVSLARQAEALGADGLLCLPAAYLANAPAQGVVQYLNAVGDAVDIPLMLYNFPRHTQNPLTPEILAGVDHFGMKDSSGDLSLLPHTPRYFMGGDPYLAEAMQRGAVGFVSAAANAAPSPYVEFETAAAQEDQPAMAATQARISQLIRALDSPQIPAIKRRLAQKIPDYPVFVRPPLAQPRR